MALVALSFVAAGGIAAGELPEGEPLAAPPGEPAAAPRPALTLEPCELPRVEGEARCGTLSVREDRASREGRRIDLRVAVLPPTGAAEPLFVITGGPGQSAVQAAGLFDHESNLVPPLVARAHRGNFRDLAALLLRLRRAMASGAIFATGLLTAVACTEDVPFIDLEEARRLAEGTFLGTCRVDQQRAVCEVWPRGELPADFTDPVRSQAPVLILSGYRDPVTPPRWGERVLPHLPNARHVVLRQGFHAGTDECERELMDRFLMAGSAAPLDASCAEEMPKTPWVLPGEEIAID